MKKSGKRKSERSKRVATRSTKTKAKKTKATKAKKTKATKAKKTKATKKPTKKAKPTLRVRKAPSRYQAIAEEMSKREANERIKDRLGDVRGLLDALGFDSRVRVHDYKDGSIDGEVLVKVPHGTSTDDLVRDMEQAMGRTSMPGFWINMGVRMTIKEDEEVYRRFRGMNDVNTHYQAAVPANWSEIPLIVRKVIISGMEKKYGRKSDSVYLRIHWNPDGTKPRERG